MPDDEFDPDDPELGEAGDAGDEEQGFRERVSKRGEEALGDLAESLLENPFFKQAIETAAGARDKAIQAQTAAMGALNLPSAADVERLTRRVRAVSQRLEGVEDGIDRLEDRLGAAAGQGSGSKAIEERLERIEAQLEELSRDVAAVRKRLSGDEAVSLDQESLGVSES